VFLSAWCWKRSSLQPDIPKYLLISKGPGLLIFVFGFVESQTDGMEFEHLATQLALAEAQCEKVQQWARWGITNAMRQNELHRLGYPYNSYNRASQWELVSMTVGHSDDPTRGPFSLAPPPVFHAETLQHPETTHRAFNSPTNHSAPAPPQHVT
jgi:hypothetical protein